MPFNGSNGKPFRNNNKRQGNRVLTYSQVQEIRTLYEAGSTQSVLCKQYGVSIGQIGRIVRGESWQDADPAVLTNKPKTAEDAQASLAKVQAMLAQPDALVAELRGIDSISPEVKEKAKEFLEAPLVKPPPMMLDDDFNPPDETDGSGLAKLQQAAKEEKE